MNIITGVAIYLALGYVLLAWLAYLDNFEVRGAFWMSLLWPCVLVAIPIALSISWIYRRGWRIDVQRRPANLSPWGKRSRPGTGRGWAVRCPWWELQVWEARPKAQRTADFHTT